MLKLDFYKAYDTVDWTFLFRVLEHRGFPRKFIEWIRLLLSSSTSEIVLNGHTGESFPHYRGLRQGDPLSPFLFVIAAEVLNKMLQAVATSIPQSISAKLPWPFFVLQYADDTLIFSTATGSAAQKLHLTLKIFSAVSGLHINASKSTLVPLNLDGNTTTAMLQLFGCQMSSLPIMYLGLPLTHGKPPRECFQNLISRVETRLAGWKGKLLSRAGRVLLTATVLSTIPVYTMSVFKLPMWVIRELDKVRRRFIWSSNSANGRGMHLVAWQRMCLPKAVGGVGLHELKLHNVALLSRWWWTLHFKEDSLWTIVAKALLAKRNCNTPPLLWNQNGSVFWRDLQTLRALFQISTIKEVEDGRNTSFWFDNWGGQPLRFLPAREGNPPKPFVSLRKGLNEINTLLPKPMNWHDTWVLREAPTLERMLGTDRVKWRWTNNGCFSVHSLYRMLSTAGKVVSNLKGIWKLHVPPTVRFFLFLLATDKLLTQSQLARRGIQVEHKCVLCGNALLETSEHLFFQCTYTIGVWTAITGETDIQGPGFTSSVKESFENYMVERDARSKGMVIAATVWWMIWLERNNRVFRRTGRRTNDLADAVISHAEAFLRCC